MKISSKIQKMVIVILIKLIESRAFLKFFLAKKTMCKRREC